MCTNIQLLILYQTILLNAEFFSNILKNGKYHKMSSFVIFA